MALRFYLPFTSLNRNPSLAGENFDVELWDSEFVGTATETDGDPQGCVIEWEGEQDPVRGVMASSATYSILIRNESEMAIITALAGAKKGRFKMVIRRADSSTVYWAGIVHTDKVSYPDEYYPFLLEVFATDGLADLQDVDYVSAPDTAYTGNVTIMDHLINIVGKIGVTDVGTWPTNRFRSTANWYSDGMNTLDGPLPQAQVMHDRFVNKDKEGNGKYWSTYAVLDALMTFMGCQFLHEGGMYHIRQLGSYANSTQKEHYYNAAGTLTSTVAAANIDREVDYSTQIDMKKQRGGRYTFLPPIKEVCVDYHHFTNHNRATGQIWKHADQTWRTLPGVVLIDANNTTYVKGSVKIRHRSQIGITTPPAIWPSHRYRFKISLRIEAGVGSYYYLKRDVSTGTVFYDLQPDELEWELAATDQIIVYGPVITQADNNVEKQFTFSFTTPDLLTSFSGSPLEMRVQLDGVEKTDGTALVLTSPPYNGNITDWNTMDVFIGVEEEGVGSNPDNETWRTCTDVTGDNTEKRYLDTYMGDGPAFFSLSAIRVDESPSVTWQVGGVGLSYPIAELLGVQFLKFRKTPQGVYQGTFIHPDIQPWERFVNDDKGWMATRISVDCFNNLWSGEFLLMDGNVDGIASSTPYIPDTKEPSFPPGYPGPPPDLPPQTPAPPDFPDHEGFVMTVPGYVTASELAPVRLTADIVASTYNTTWQLTVSPLDFSWAKKGDQLTLLNPITGYRETLTVATTYVPGATTLAMKTSESMVKDFPYGTIVKLAPAVELQMKGWSYYERGVTGTGTKNKFWLIPTATGELPDPTVYDAATIRERVTVIMGGLVLLYDANGYDDTFGIKPSTNEIEVYTGIQDVTMYVKVN